MQGGSDHAGSSSERGEAGMTTFDKREEGFEKQFAHDEELKFKATGTPQQTTRPVGRRKARPDRRRRRGLCQGGRDGRFREPGDEDVFRKVRKDFDAKGVAVPDPEIRRMMIELMGTAITQIKDGK